MKIVGALSADGCVGEMGSMFRKLKEYSAGVATSQKQPLTSCSEVKGETVVEIVLVAP